MKGGVYRMLTFIHKTGKQEKPLLDPEIFLNQS